MKYAICPRCKGAKFIIYETRVVCASCSWCYAFEFMDPEKKLCVTKADDIVRIVEGD